MVRQVRADVVYICIAHVVVGNTQRATVLEDDYSAGPHHVRTCTIRTTDQRGGRAVVILALDIGARTVKQMKRAGTGKSKAIKMEDECATSVPEERGEFGNREGMLAIDRNRKTRNGKEDRTG